MYVVLLISEDKPVIIFWGDKGMTIETKSFGQSPDGKEIVLFTMTNRNHMEVSLTNVGATIVRIVTADGKGELKDVVLGFDKGEDYFDNGSFFGVVVGPSANRIADASFEIDGKAYEICRNDGNNNLHSDMNKGYHKCIWDATVTDKGVVFCLQDSDGNMGFPGNKKVSVEYTLDDDNALTLKYHASSDANTIINLTNHSYFNLNGHDSGNIMDHQVMIKASNFTPVVEGAIPTGEIASVIGTSLDFTKMMGVGERIDADYEQNSIVGGYDHNWVIDDCDGSLRHIATVRADKCDRQMDVYTTLPGVQFYTGNFISPIEGKEGCLYGKRQGLCLETQYYPDTIHNSNFPSCIFGPGKDYDSVTVYKFSCYR